MHSGARYHLVETYEVCGPDSTDKSLHVPKSMILATSGFKLTMMLSGLRSLCRIPHSSFKYCMPVRICFIMILISDCSSNFWPALTFLLIYYVRLISICSNTMKSLRFSYSMRSAFITNGQCVPGPLLSILLNLCRI